MPSFGVGLSNCRPYLGPNLNSQLSIVAVIESVTQSVQNRTVDRSDMWYVA